MLATVVIPTFNRADDLSRTLDALRNQRNQQFAVIVVDNSSTDHTAALIAEQRHLWGERLLYEVKEPNGPASARNRGLELAETEYVLFLDSDVELEPGWIEAAYAHFADDDAIGAVGGRVIYAFDRSLLNAYGGDIGWFGLAWDMCEGGRVVDADTVHRRVWINCSAMMVRREVFEVIGGFDDTFFYGFEDSDLGWRICMAGFGVLVYPGLNAFHHVEEVPGRTSPVIVFHYCKNRLRSLLRNSSAATLIPRLLAYGAYSVVDLVLRGPRLAKLQALAWNLRNLRDTVRARGRTQSRRKLSDSAIFSLSSGRMFPPQRLGGLRRRRTGAARLLGRDQGSASVRDDRV